jgi:feruloyl-CoA synthase
MQETLRNLREIATNVYFNVPKGFEELVHAFESDARLPRDLLPTAAADVLRGGWAAQASGGSAICER